MLSDRELKAFKRQMFWYDVGALGCLIGITIIGLGLLALVAAI